MITFNTIVGEGDWINISPTVGGVGKDTVYINVVANEGDQSRKAEVTIKVSDVTKKFTIQQPGKDYIKPNDNTPVFEIEALEGNFSFGFTATPNDWNATITPVVGTANLEWISMTPTTGPSGEGTLSFVINKNETFEKRGATVLITEGTATYSFTIEQKGIECSLVPDDERTKFEFEYGSSNLTYTFTATPLDWTASIEAEEGTPNLEWISMTPNTGVSGQGSIEFTINENNTSDPRGAKVTITESNLTHSFSIVQKSFSIDELNIQSATKLPIALCEHFLLIDGNEFIVGGGHTTNFLVTKRSFKSSDFGQTYSEMTLVSHHDMSLSVDLGNGNFLVGGGCGTDYGVGRHNKVEMINVANKTTSSKANLPDARNLASGVKLTSGKVLIAGNFLYSATTADIYDPETNSFGTSISILTEFSYPIIFPTNDGGAVILAQFSAELTNFSNIVVLKWSPESTGFTPLTGGNWDDFTKGKLNCYPSRAHSYKPTEDGNYLFVVQNSQKEYELMLFDFKAVSLSKVSLDKPLLKDYPGIEEKVTWLTETIVNASKNEVYLRGYVDGSKTMLVATINYKTGKSAIAKTNGMEYVSYSAKVGLLGNGNLVMTGGSRKDNFVVSDEVYIITPPEIK